jgi:xanthine dehydrogenase YagR molybdenum-binding subunit
MVLAHFPGIGKIGEPTHRIDGPLKVTGQARYASDIPVLAPAYAWLVTSAIARGRVAKFDLVEARSVAGVLDIMTWENTAGEVHKPSTGKTGHAGTSIRPLDSPRIHHAGQIIAVVLAETSEVARDAAHRVRVEYAEETPSASFDSPGVTSEPAGDADNSYRDAIVGDAEQAFAAAPVRLDERYETPTQHHNPIELFTTTCAWDGERLTVYEPTQFMYGLKYGVAEQLGIDPRDVRTISPFVGGAFGSKGTVTNRTALIAIAAKRLGRPVKLMATRDQGFTIATYRAETRQRVRLAAGHDGRLQALIHDGWELSSRPDPYKVAGNATTARMYACPNVATSVTIVHADRNTPGFMRSPPELPYMFALESAMDELAVALEMDPVELRRVNDTMHEPIQGLPYSSRALMPCFDRAAASFGWSGRSAGPRSMRDGDWLIGWGCAASCYPSHVAPAAVRVRLDQDGQVRVQTAGHEIGTGAYTAIALVAADRLGVALDAVDVELGDSELPPAPIAGGSNNTASICNCVAEACEQIRERLARAAQSANDGALAGRDPASLHLADGALRAPDGASETLQQVIVRAASGVVEAYAETIPIGLSPESLHGLYRGHSALKGGASGKETVDYAFGAEFVEVRVNAHTGEIRTPRITGAFAAGRVINPMAARSQLMGGLIWGVSAALHEATQIDRREARYTNTNLADYLVPVNADIPAVDVILLEEDDHKVNPLGIKGIGELGNVGTNAAVANAVFHATGRRLRTLPIRLEALLG